MLSVIVERGDHPKHPWFLVVVESRADGVKTVPLDDGPHFRKKRKALAAARVCEKALNSYISPQSWQLTQLYQQRSHP